MSGYWYLATPYSKYPEGPEAAWKEASKQAAICFKAGISVFCPIAHTHSIAIEGDLAGDYKMWNAFDVAMMNSAKGLIVCKMKSWDISYGIEKEIEYMASVCHKPVKFMVPGIAPNID